MAAEVGIDEVIAGVLPADKVAAVRRLQEEGTGRRDGRGRGQRRACARAADLGIAMGTGTDVAIEAARPHPRPRRPARGGGRDPAVASHAVDHQGQPVWAFGYNVAAIPLAAAGLLNPMLAGAAMALSSVFVVTNSLRLRRFR